MMKPGRNEPCPCGSGKKYKRCCYLKEQTASETNNEESAFDEQSFLLDALTNLRRLALRRKPHIKDSESWLSTPAFENASATASNCVGSVYTSKKVS